MTAEDAAYRALAQFRIPAAERREFAVRVVATLAEIPREFLPFQAEAGVASGLAADLRQHVPLTVPPGRRLDAAAAAVGAAAQAMLEEA